LKYGNLPGLPPRGRSVGYIRHPGTDAREQPGLPLEPGSSRPVLPFGKNGPLLPGL